MEESGAESWEQEYDMSGVALADPDSLLLGYFESSLNGGFSAPRRSVPRGDSLTGNERLAYDTIRPMIQAVAAGERASTEFEVPLSAFGIDAENGIYHVNGRQALKYCRNRSSTPGADYDRTQRQRIVLKTIWNKVREMPVTKQTAVATKALEYVTTDLSRSECLALVAKLPQIKDYEFVSQRIPIDGTSVAYNPDPKFSIVSMEFPPNRAFLLDSLYGIEE